MSKKNKKRIILTLNDWNDGEVTCNVGSKTYGIDLSNVKEQIVERILRDFLVKNTKMTDYEEDCMWMSYRYCIGRKTIAAHMHAGNIWKNCKGRMNPERQLFTAYDINNQVEGQIRFMTPHFYFPSLGIVRITYGTSVDVVCEFLNEYQVKSKEDFLKYRTINIILADNDRGYKFETETWEEWLRPSVLKAVKERYKDSDVDEEAAWGMYISWGGNKDAFDSILSAKFEELERQIPNPEHYYMSDFEDLFVWNELAHAFDFEHHHKSVLVDGSEVEWFWSWTHNTELGPDGFYHIAFGYHKIRVPVNEWNGNVTRYISEDAIIKDLY